MGGWDWLTALFGEKSVKLEFDNSKNAGRDLNTSSSRNKQLDKSDKSSTTKTRSKDTYHGDVVHSDGPVNIYNGPVSYSIHVPLNERGEIPATALPVLAPLTEQFEQKQVAFLAQDEKQIVLDIRAFEATSEVRGLLKFFRHRLKPNDHIRMRTGLYIKHLNETGRFQEANHYWQQVTGGMRQRDRRIIELASAGYFYSFFRPLYKQFEKANVGTAQKRFVKEFDSILEDMRFAIFISSSMSVEEIVDIVLKKAVRNIKYGSQTQLLSLHAAGAKQVTRVKEALVLLHSSFPVMETHHVPKNTSIIRVDIEYRKNNLEDELLQDDVIGMGSPA